MIKAPSKMPEIPLVDINGQQVQVGQGKKILLSLFREATCPFCNYRVYELTHNTQMLNDIGVEIVTVFSSNKDDVLKYIAKQPRPFRIIADPLNYIHQSFSVNSSLWGKIKAMIFRMPAMLRGMSQVGMRGIASGNLMPADFLIDRDGCIVETYYGEDVGDHIPLDRIEKFATAH